MPTDSKTVQIPANPTGYVMAASVRIALCLLVLTFTLRVMLTIPNGIAILSAVLIYLGYSIVLLIDSLRSRTVLGFFKRFSILIDGIYCTSLTAISGGFQSPFGFLYFFAVIDIATSQPFTKSITGITALMLAFGAVSIATMKPPASNLDVVTALPVLLILGIIIAFRSQSRRDLKNRLALLQQITAVASPMIGLERSIGVTLGLLQSHLDAKECILVTKDEDTKEFSFFKSPSESMTDPNFDSEIPEEGFLRRLLSLLPYHAVVFDGKLGWFKKTRLLAVKSDSFEKVESRSEEETCSILSEMLDAPRFLSVPIKTGRSCSGRLYVLNSAKGRKFHSMDLHLVNQVAQILAPLIENARLIDRISSNAAEEERRRIARDIHDSIIQPHLGIKFGLESISSLLNEEADVTATTPIVLERVRNLHALTEATVDNLRGLVHGLADSTSSGNTLLPSVKRFADKFAGATGIAVHVVANGDMRSVDKLAPDVFQLAVEGLSNIRKHTGSSKALIQLAASDNLLNLRISNENADDKPFRPRSLSERVAALGGTIDVLKDDGYCTVEINIPI